MHPDINLQAVRLDAAEHLRARDHERHRWPRPPSPSRRRVAVALRAMADVVAPEPRPAVRA
jgi:hypothetical protein